MSGNTANLQALSIEVGNAETELTFAQAQVQAEVYKILTAEQKQKITERRKQMEERRQEMLKRRQERTCKDGFQEPGEPMFLGFRVFRFQGFWFRGSGSAVPVPDVPTSPRRGTRNQNCNRNLRNQNLRNLEPLNRNLRNLEPTLLCCLVMQRYVPLTRRFLVGSLAAAVLFLVTSRAEAQGIGFQGGATVDPEQASSDARRNRGNLPEFPLQAGTRRQLRRRFHAGCHQR